MGCIEFGEDGLAAQAKRTVGDERALEEVDTEAERDRPHGRRPEIAAEPKRTRVATAEIPGGSDAGRLIAAGIQSAPFSSESVVESSGQSGRRQRTVHEISFRMYRILILCAYENAQSQQCHRRVCRRRPIPLQHGGHAIRARRFRRRDFERNLAAKLHDRQFSADIGPLLAHNYRWDMEGAARTVSSRLIARLPGAPWKGWTGA